MLGKGRQEREWGSSTCRGGYIRKGYRGAEAESAAENKDGGKGDTGCIRSVEGPEKIHKLAFE